jgi:hypothetical protein
MSKTIELSELPEGYEYWKVTQYFNTGYVHDIGNNITGVGSVNQEEKVCHIYIRKVDLDKPEFSRRQIYDALSNCTIGHRSKLGKQILEQLGL